MRGAEPGATAPGEAVVPRAHIFSLHYDDEQEPEPEPEPALVFEPEPEAMMAPMDDAASETPRVGSPGPEVEPPIEPSVETSAGGGAHRAAQASMSVSAGAASGAGGVSNARTHPSHPTAHCSVHE